ncbi:TetR/AcrR family transcriptional regulator [Paraburkholderia rhizosphaerae]|uniref:TetR family transcriptional regulator n=1 Tax=Paraburkholderia rhizosphaerae TaxID=480658 RepID=A0A4R8L880_9BURK|nr:TetR/AcrR family transcriptional regulator [Paraburkholderia rhizosphaerae]TDY38911.1 TetR family transcriptional regulator [Paraburkholderia rhizosphaerae]
MSNSSSERRRPKQARASFALDSILEAAARTLEVHGKSGLTTQRVADTAGFSIGALYQYFPNKEGLIEALARRELERLTDLMTNALANPAPFGMGINARRMIRAVAAFIADRPRLYGILRAEWSDAASGSPIGEGMRRYFDLISNTLHNESPELGKRIAVDEARFVLFRAISGVLLATALERPEYLGTRRFEDEMVRLILGFVGHDVPAGIAEGEIAAAGDDNAGRYAPRA